MLLMGTSTISMVIFNSYVKLPEGSLERFGKCLTFEDLTCSKPRNTSEFRWQFPLENGGTWVHYKTVSQAIL